MEGAPVKSTIVDSKPILHGPPFNINLIFFPNSSTTSSALVGLSLEEIFALGAAKGTFKIFNKFLATICFGNLTATVFFPAVANLEIFDFNSLFNIKVIGPGQKALYSLKKYLFKIASFFKSLIL